MSQEERDRLDWLKRAKAGSISQREAAAKMGVSTRWVRKLLKRMAKDGDAVVVHGLRGRPSNRKLSAKIQRQALSILKQPELRFSDMLTGRGNSDRGRGFRNTAGCRGYTDLG